MDIADIVLALSKRVPWPVAIRLLREHQIPRSKGWEKTVQALQDPKEDLSEKIDDLRQSLTEHLLCGEKLVRFYKVTNQQKKELLKAVLGWKIPESPFKKTFPTYLSDEELQKAPTAPTLTKVSKNESGIGIVYSSARVVTMREHINEADLAPEVRETYEEVFGLKHVRHQAMDVVWIPLKGDIIEVRIDFPFGMHRDVGEAAQERVKALFSKKTQLDYLGTPVDIFPLINKIYRAPNEGSVVELAFGTTTASNKIEKMRRKSSCLRKETYHMGGKAALGTPIEPYRLSVVWKIALSDGKYSAPELSLNSSTRVAHGSTPALYDAIVRNCMGYVDYEHVVTRMEKHL